MRTINPLVIVGLAVAGILAILGLAVGASAQIAAASLFQISGTQITPIFPSWSINIPLAPPSNFRAASSTSPGGSLSTSTTPLYFRVAAINGTGTTTVSSEIATTTRTGSSRIHFSWTPVPGATGYAIFYSTTTPGAQNAYQLATTTNQYDFTSTSSPLYGRPPAFPSAFAAQLSNGTSSLSANGVNLTPFATTTVAIGGGALSAGACATATSTLAFGNTVSSSTVFMTTPRQYPGGVVWDSYALSSTQVVTRVCALTATTPISTIYNLRAF